ncbi:MAG: AsmA-like C-terminal region-containing protein [Pirellulales bacterium]
MIATLSAKGIAVIPPRPFHFCWSCVKYTSLVALAAAVGAGLYYYNHVNDEIRRRVLEMLATHYVGLDVEVRSALLVNGEGIEIRGITISDPQLSGPSAELAYFDEILLACRTELQEFLSGQPKIEHVRVRRPRIRATRLADGRWSAARLLPCPKFGKHRLETVIENGVLELIDSTRPNSPTFTLREINLELHPLTEEHAGGDEPVRFKASCGGDYFQRVTMAGRLEANGEDFHVEQGVINGLDISPEFRSALPAELAEPFAAIASLRATCGLTFAVIHRPLEEQPWTFSVDGHISRGRYDDPRLPQALTELTADFHANNSGLVVKELMCKFGQSSLNAYARLDGFSSKAPLFLDIIAKQLFVGRNWEAILSPQLLTHWRNFEPAGEIDAHLKLWFDGSEWRPEATVDCRNVSFTYYKFPYRVDRGRGIVELKDNRLSLNLVAQAAGRDITIRGLVNDPGPAFTGGVEIRGEDLSIEPRIIDALRGKPRDIVRSLNPTGTFGFVLNVFRDDAQQARPHQELALRLQHGSVRYDKFAYPISNIRGTVQMRDGAWWSDDLKGNNDIGQILCRARLQHTDEGSELTLHFDGQGIALEEELRDALPAPARKVWNDLRPRGSIDLGVDVKYIAGSRKPSIAVRINQFGDNASLEPVQFPYRLERLRGSGGERPVFVYSSDEDRVDFAELRAVHGRTKVSATGYCRFNEGAWRLHFKRLTADQLRADPELLAALPPALKKVGLQLKPTGAINLYGSFDLAGSGVTGDPLKSAWNLDFTVHQSSITAGVLLENVRGMLHLEGQHDGRRLWSAGELTIDSLAFKEFQFTDLRGPLWIDDQKVILGTHARPPQLNQAPRRMTAKLYGGTVVADLSVSLREPPDYVLQATLSNGDLERLAREQLAGKQRLKGRVGAGLVLGGRGAGVHAMEGYGQVWLREADIYELPLMVQLLSILSIRLPDNTGFTNSDANFRIDGEHIYLDRIEFAGDAISLVGTGEMNLNSDIQATLSAIVGRSDWQLPLFKNVMGQASQQIMQIRVDGNLASPSIHREAFPGINQVLEQLQAGMQPRVQPLPLPQPSTQAAVPGGGRR